LLGHAQVARLVEQTSRHSEERVSAGRTCRDLAGQHGPFGLSD
jgi:hypothetical protein